MKLKSTLALAACLITAAHGANVIHYWDMSEALPADSVGGVAMTAGPNLDLAHSAYGATPGSGGQYLHTTLGIAGVPLTAAVNGTAMGFGTDNWSFSYWTYDDTSDGNVNGPRIFDSLSGTTTGIQLGTSADPYFNLRIDDSLGGAHISKNTLFIYPLSDQWVHVAVNVDRSAGQAEVFFDGASQGTFAVSTTGDIFPTQDMEIGSINGGDSDSKLQSGGLDDLAFYDGTLSQAEVTGLANGTLTPNQIPEPSVLLLGALSGLALLRRRRA